ncbi:hypothetical protein P0W64_13805 [Tsukamurella sp. 8F]|uniref:hypothetical protein n=1 Tax=unclassified Tsukamurella TaxID=2633480 RepID=UPI0023B9BADF|nr:MULTISPECIES: hypothetical protein [unclassified Tsukamurella]MDF0530647.1 hypothetical protein [Tsukamurella sp. 8J]MDF0587848.1 hypothetical protein [Tsukamurella sp. 8F]
MNARFRRWLARGVGSAVIAVVAVTAAGYPVYVAPRTDAPTRADAVVVIGGPGAERYTYGIELAERGLAPRLVISDPDWASHQIVGPVCAQPSRRGYTVTCFRPDPPTTKGEIKELNKLAHSEQWRTIDLVTFTPHVSRTRYLLDRCYSGDVRVSANPQHIGFVETAWQYVYQTAGYARALVQRGC